MWLKNGVQVCNRCGGQGCYHCQRTGIIVMCPACGCRENDQLGKIDGDTYHCSLCGTDFSRSGKIVKFKEPEPSRPSGKKWDPSKGVPPKGS